MNQTLIDELRGIADYAGQFFVEFLIFIIGLLVFVSVIGTTVWLGGRVRQWLVRRAEQRWPDNANLPSLLDNAFRVALFVAGLVLALGVVGASTDSLVTWIGIIVAALSIAMQDVIKNLVAGFYLLTEHRFGAGDRIVVSGERGVIERVDLRVTAIRNNRQQLVLVPNYLVFSQVVTARTAREPDCLVLTVSGIADDPITVRQSLDEVLTSFLGVAPSTSEIQLSSIRTTGVTLTARVSMEDHLSKRDALILAIHDRFPTAEIVVSEE